MHDNDGKGFTRFIRKACLFLSAFLVSFVSCFAFCVPAVNADTTYYSFPFYVASNNGEILGNVTINIPRVRGVIVNTNNGTTRKYQVLNYVYITGSNQQSDFINAFGTLYGVGRYGSPSSWTYNSAVEASYTYGSFTDTQGQLVRYYCGYFAFDPNQFYLSTYAPAGTDMISSSVLDLNAYGQGGGNSSNYAKFLKAAIYFRETGQLLVDDNNFTMSSFAGGWVKDDNAITPAYDMNDITTDGTIENNTPSPTGSPEPTSSPEGGTCSDCSLSQSQTQSIAEGAVAFTVADGAFQNTNSYSPTLSQAIEENAVNVTVNNENGVTQNNIQWLDNLINNSEGGEEGENPFSQAIGNVNKFVGIGRAFAVLVGVVFGWLPWWVTDLVSMMFSMLFVFVIFRLVHVFK